MTPGKMYRLKSHKHLDNDWSVCIAKFWDGDCYVAILVGCEDHNQWDDYYVIATDGGKGKGLFQFEEFDER